MIFRITQKASSKLRVMCSAATGTRPVMQEWYCNLMTVQRRQLFLFTHAVSLFSFWVPAAGSSLDNFGEMFRRHAMDTLRDYRFSEADASQVLDKGPDVFAKVTDRGVVGSMVDFAKMLRYVVHDEGGLDRLRQRALNDIANDCPMSKIDMEHPAERLRRILMDKRPYDIAVHRAGARPPSDQPPDIRGTRERSRWAHDREPS